MFNLIRSVWILVDVISQNRDKIIDGHHAVEMSTVDRWNFKMGHYLFELQLVYQDMFKDHCCVYDIIKILFHC